MLSSSVKNKNPENFSLPIFTCNINLSCRYFMFFIIFFFIFFKQILQNRNITSAYVIHYHRNVSGNTPDIDRNLLRQIGKFHGNLLNFIFENINLTKPVQKNDPVIFVHFISSRIIMFIRDQLTSSRYRRNYCYIEGSLQLPRSGVPTASVITFVSFCRHRPSANTSSVCW